jgi:hypothetical protein
MTAQLDNLQVIANKATTAVNARGEALEFRLQDIPVRAREIALHGVYYGTTHALTAAHLQSGQDLRAIEPRYPMFDLRIQTRTRILLMSLLTTRRR